MSPLSSAECFAHIYMGETTAVYWQDFSQTCPNQPFFLSLPSLFRFVTASFFIGSVRFHTLQHIRMNGKGAYAHLRQESGPLFPVLWRNLL